MKILPRIIYKLYNLFWKIINPTTVGVRLILEKNHKVVLVKHTYHKQWYLPGGGVKKGENFEEAIRRETKEELGITLGPIQLLGLYSNFYESKNDHIAVFSCNDFELVSHTNYEIECIKSFAIDELPNDISPGSLRRIHEYEIIRDIPVVGMW